jgi:eukaryotic-like serine/threonine-protein kinase
MYDDRDGWDATAPVGSFPDGASPYGALDMAGNVCEWTADWYGSYAREAHDNPRGPKDSSARVYRGGGWFDNGVGVRGAFRGRYEPAHRNAGLGFRCARDTSGR